MMDWTDVSMMDWTDVRISWISQSDPVAGQIRRGVRRGRD